MATMEVRIPLLEDMDSKKLRKFLEQLEKTDFSYKVRIDGTVLVS